MSNRPASEITPAASPLTSYRLTKRVGLTLCMLCLLFASIADFFLYQSLISKDLGLIDARQNNYQRILNHAGLDKLIEVINQEKPDENRWLIEITGNNALIFSNQTATDDTTLRLSDPFWPVLNTEKKRWLVPDTDQGQNTILIGLSSLERQQQQVTYRWAMLFTLLPLILISLFLMYRIHNHALYPLRGFLKTTQQMQQNADLRQRFSVSEPDTELGQLALQTNRFLDTNERLFTGMQASLDNVAHDLRTPLARQRLRVDQLLMKPQIQQDNDTFDTLAQISEESERIEKMLTTLMDISQAESGTLPLKKEPLDLNTLMQQAVEVYSFVAEDKNCTLELNISGHCRIEADEMRLRQVLLNLLDNALKYSPDNSSVCLSATRQGDEIVITVTDQGAGIPAEDLPYIYDRLFRGDKSRSSQGLGLGLSLVKAVVEAHQGNILVTSTTGDNPGTCFTIHIPAQSGYIPAQNDYIPTKSDYPID